MGKRVPLHERFWARVDVRGDDDCWVWGGAKQREYGAVRLTLPGGIRRMVNAQRVAFAITYGPIGDADHVMHSCDVPLCVNPKHLSIGDRSANMQDAARKGRMSPHGRWVPVADSVVSQIADDIRGGAYVRATARKYGVAPGTVRRIRSRLVAGYGHGETESATS